MNSKKFQVGDKIIIDCKWIRINNIIKNDYKEYIIDFIEKFVETEDEYTLMCQCPLMYTKDIYHQTDLRPYSVENWSKIILDRF